MSQHALELLQTLGLLDKAFRPVDLTRFTEDELRSILDYYARKRLDKFQDEVDQLSHQRDTLSAHMSSLSAEDSTRSLLAALLVYSHVFADDPIFRDTVREGETSRTAKRAMGIAGNAAIDREGLSSHLAHFSALAGIIREGFLVCLPLHAMHFPAEDIPLYYSPDAFRSQVPQHIHDFVHKQAVVLPVVVDKPTGWLLVYEKGHTEHSRGIDISFKEDVGAQGHGIYFYHEWDNVAVDRKTGRISFTMQFDLDKPLAPDVYRAWVYQSINRTIINRLQAIGREVLLARSLRATYMTESRFEASLLGMSTSGVPCREETNAVNFLMANSPLLRIDSPQTVLEVRTQNPDLLRRFQCSLLELAERLRGLGNEEFREKASQLFAREVQPQVEALQRTIDAIRSSAYKGGLVSLGTLALAVLSGTSLPLVGALAYLLSGCTAETLPAIADYLHATKQPEYIWSRLAK